MIEQYPLCPRCQGQWLNERYRDYYSCSICYLRCVEGGIPLSSVFPNRFVWMLPLSDKDLFIWDCDRHNCRYLANQHFSDCWQSAIILPWLPFDITAEKLKTLLIFS